MRVSYGEGLASHSGPESCVCIRKGAGEALTGGAASRDIEPRKSHRDRDASAVHWSEGQHQVNRNGEVGRVLRGRRPRARAQAFHAGTERSWNWPCELHGPQREPQGGTSLMNGTRKSDSCIVPEKPANKGSGAPRPAEEVEGRRLTKGNSGQQNRRRTQGRGSLHNTLDRIRQAESARHYPR